MLARIDVSHTLVAFFPLEQIERAAELLTEGGLASLALFGGENHGHILRICLAYVIGD